MSDFLQAEDSTYLLQEDGDKIILVFFAPTPPAPTPTKKKSGFIWFEEERKRKPEPVVLVEPNLVIKMRT